MREIEIDIDQMSPREIQDILREENPSKGDHVKLFGLRPFSATQTFSIMFYMFLFFLMQKEKRKKFGAEILDKLFSKYSNEKELETEIEKEYGIKVTVETVDDTEREDWMRFSAMQFEKGFTDPDDDYSDVPVLKPNPNYVPWKKEI